MLFYPLWHITILVLPGYLSAALGSEFVTSNSKNTSLSSKPWNRIRRGNILKTTTTKKKQIRIWMCRELFKRTDVKAPESVHCVCYCVTRHQPGFSTRLPWRLRVTLIMRIPGDVLSTCRLWCCCHIYQHSQPEQPQITIGQVFIRRLLRDTWQLAEPLW